MPRPRRDYPALLKLEIDRVDKRIAKLQQEREHFVRMLEAAGVAPKPKGPRRKPRR